MKLDRRIKTALDETRLLILGSQVLFGFLLESAFQNGFDALPGSSQYLVCAALGLMVLSIGCLIAPSMQHRIVEAGQSTPRLERATSVLAAWSLLPFMASLGLGLFIVFQRVFGAGIALAVGAASTALAGFSVSASHGSLENKGNKPWLLDPDQRRFRQKSSKC